MAAFEEVPRSLLKAAMKELKRYLREMAPTDEGEEDWSRYKMMGLTRHAPNQIRVRNQRELVTLVSGKDLLLQL